MSEQISKVPSWLRLIVTSRPEPVLQHQLQAFTQFAMDSTSENNLVDIRRFLGKELAPLADNKKISRDIIDIVTDRSEGAFLYVEWVRQELASGRLMLDRLDEFPQGLGGIFAQYVRRQFPDINFFQDQIRPALGLVFAAKDPLPMQIVAQILGWEDEYKTKDFLASLGTLFRFDSDCIFPFHKSLQDWLLDAPKAGRYFVSLQEGHKMLASKGWDAFCSKGHQLSKSDEHCLKELHFHLIHSRQEQDKQRLFTYITNIDVFVQLYWKNMYEAMRCWAAIGDRAAYGKIYKKQLTEYETDCPDSKRIAVAYRTVGLLLYYDKKCNEAEPFFEKAAHLYGEMGDELKLALTLNDLAEAGTAYQQALDIRRRVLSDNHEDTAESINNYGHFFLYKGDNVKAEKLYQEAFEIRKGLFPSCHPKIAEGYNNLGVVAAAQGDQEKAAECYRNAFQIMEQGGFIETWEAALYSEQLARALMTEKNYDESEKLWCMALNIRKKIFGWHHAETISSLFNLAQIYTIVNKLPKLYALLNQMPAESVSKIMPPEQFIEQSKTLLSILTDRDDQQRVESFIEHLSEFMKKIYQNVNLKALCRHMLLVQYNLSKMRHADAASQYCQALEAAEKHYGILHIETLKICNQCACEYRIAGEIQRSYDFYSRTIELGKPIVDGNQISEEQLKQEFIFLVAVAHNEIAFHIHVPGKKLDLAEEYYQLALEYMKNSGKKIEMVNIELNLNVARHRSGKKVDIEKVKELVAFLKDANDPRAEKGDEIIKANSSVIDTFTKQSSNI